MRLLVTADWHIHHHPGPKGEDSDLPYSLARYLQLADWLLELYQDKGCDLLVIAGDILHTTQPPPLVSNMVKDVLLKLSTVNLFIIDGNHDTDIRYGVPSRPAYYSALRAISPERVRYNESLEMEGFYLQGVPFYLARKSKYAPRPESDKPTVLVSHGLVAGAANAEGYVFSGGFDPSYLEQTFHFSIIGDIHLGQLPRPTVLIPGTPLQNSYSDPEEVGVWIVDLCPDKEPQLEYYSTPREIDPRLPARQRRSVQVVKEKAYSTTEAAALDIEALVKEAARHTLKPLKVDESLKEEARQLALALYESCHAKHKPTARLPWKVKSLSIQNFMAIEEITIPLDNPGPLVILGENGVGKSSILEAVVWCLYGQPYHATRADDVIRDVAGGDCQVELMLINDKGELGIRRTRKHSRFGSGLYIKWQTDDWMQLKSTSREVEELLGVGKEEFTTFMYHPQGRIADLEGLSLTAAVNLLKLLYNIDILTILTDEAATFYRTVNENLMQARGQLTEAERVQQELEKFAAASTENSTLEEDLAQVQAQLEEKQGLARALRSKVADLSAQLSDLRSQLSLKQRAQKVLGSIPGVEACRNCPLVKDYWAYASLSLESQLADLQEYQEALRRELEKVEVEVSQLRAKQAEIASKLEASRYVASLKGQVVDVGALKQQVEALERKSQVADLVRKYIYGPKGILPIVASELLNSIIAPSNELLKETVDISVRFTPARTQTGAMKGGLTLLATIKGKERPYGRLSGGQKLLVTLAFIVAVANTLAEAQVGPQILLADEIAQYFDYKLMEVAKQLLLQCRSKVVLVTHLPELAEAFGTVGEILEVR